MIETITYYDNILLGFIQNHMRNAVFDAVMPVITSFGDNGFIWILASVIFIFLKKYRTDGISILIALLLCILAGNLGLKPMVARLRPSDVDSLVDLLITRPTDYSFPSAHTMTSFTSAIVIFHANKRIGAFAVILAALIAFSRLYLYVHYPSDVFGGMLIGIALGFLAIFIVKAMGKLNRGKSFNTKHR